MVQKVPVLPTTMMMVVMVHLAAAFYGGGGESCCGKGIRTEKSVMFRQMNHAMHPILVADN
jgi:hypothetical protein